MALLVFPGLLQNHGLLHLDLLLGDVDVVQSLDELLIMHLLLWTRVLKIILVGLHDHPRLNLQVTFLIFQTLLLEERDPEPGFPPLSVEKSSDEALDFDGGEVLGRHRSRPRLLDDALLENKVVNKMDDFQTYSLAKSMLPLEVRDHTNFDSSVNSLDLSRGLATSHLPMVAADHRDLIVKIVSTEGPRSLAKLAQIVGLHGTVVSAIAHS